jgi:glutathione S-transferase
VALTLHYHPLSSFCWKVLIALYEADVAFEPMLLANLMEPENRAAFQAIWPIGKFPVLEDHATGSVVAESSTIIRWLARRYAAAAPLVPDDAELAWQVDLRDRVLDNYVHRPWQEIIGDRLRPAQSRDPLGVAQAREQIRTAFGYLEPLLAGGGWGVGPDFTLADCAALPALFYASQGVPLDAFPNLAAYLERLKARPTIARVLQEAEPYFHMVPKEPA